MKTDSAWICLMCRHRHHQELVREDEREGNICHGCGSSTRSRAMAQAVLATMGSLSSTYRQQPPRAAGVSDSPVFARWMDAMTDYVDYRFGAEPHLDLTEIPNYLRSAFEIVTCSDVLEHVTPPVGRAFVGMFGLLAPGGFAIVSVPGGDDCAAEHFPDLYEWHVDGEGDERVLVNTRVDGSIETYDNLVWHGGDGWTLEMRLFDRDWLRREFAEAGFVEVTELRRNWPHLGISWEDWSRVWMARKPVG